MRVLLMAALFCFTACGGGGDDPPPTDSTTSNDVAGADAVSSDCPADLVSAEGSECSEEGKSCSEGCEHCEDSCVILECSGGVWGLAIPTPPECPEDTTSSLDESTAVDEGTASDESTAVDEGGPLVPTWTDDIKPLVDAKCVPCHTQNSMGGISLNVYSDVTGDHSKCGVTVAESMAEVVKSNPACGDVMPPGGALPAEEIQLLQDWVNGGYPE